LCAPLTLCDAKSSHVIINATGASLTCTPGAGFYPRPPFSQI